MLYYIDLGFAVFGIIEQDGIVVKAAPIAYWTIGKSIDFVLNSFKKRNGIVIKIDENRLLAASRRTTMMLKNTIMETIIWKIIK